MLHGKSSALQMLPQGETQAQQHPRAGDRSGRAPGHPNRHQPKGDCWVCSPSISQEPPGERHHSAGGTITPHTNTQRCSHVLLCRTQHHSIWHTSMASHATAKPDIVIAMSQTQPDASKALSSVTSPARGCSRLAAASPARPRRRVPRGGHVLG